MVNSTMSQDSLPRSSIILYNTEDGRSRVECRLDAGTIWLTQAQISELFQTTPQNVTLHLRAIYTSGELDQDATCKEYLQVRWEGQREVSRSLRHYRLEVILAVGYRVRSPRGTQFRQWATAHLSEYLVKGFVIDDERLKNPTGQPDYFDELLERIRDIRASERRVYLRVRDILALAADYSPHDSETRRFFQVVQNKLHFAATGKTAPELIAERADAASPNMGLTTWKGGVVRRGDVTIAKNYLREDEIDELNRIVVMFLDFAEDQARRRKQVFLRDWESRLDDFLRFNERPILPDAGTITREDADALALETYDRFSARRRAEVEAAAEESMLRELNDAVAALSAAPSPAAEPRKPRERRPRGLTGGSA